MRIRFAGVIQDDRCRHLPGRSRPVAGKPLRVVTVVDGKGDEFDLGELTTSLKDAVLLAPTFLLQPAMTWSEADDTSFDVTIAIAGRSVMGRVFLDGHGAPVDFSTTDRFAVLPADYAVPNGTPRSQRGRIPPSEDVLGRSPPCGTCPKAN
jgi:hypothetical protein